MAKPDHLIIAAGTLAFVSNFKEAGGFPENGATTIAGTAALAAILATQRSSRIAPVVSAFAALVLLAAAFYYIPGLTKKQTGTTRRKLNKLGKDNG